MNRVKPLDRRDYNENKKEKYKEKRNQIPIEP